ncbi:Sec34-like family-domain-containing protein [Scheffersomyces xylosifermentans]|uniref:Sec34-like family-domain-containing protein n=1 Tax=Scheffersomyces xylosifermentans TaxID=1304137 RepID=UPI00315DEDEA
MARGRSKSIVKKIASDVPQYEEDHLNLGSLITPVPTTFKLTRSKSFSEISASTIQKIPEVENGPENLPIYPFNKRESEKLWHNYVETFNYDCLLKQEDIEVINEIRADEILNFQYNITINQSQIEDFIIETDGLLDSVNELMSKYDQISHETLDFDKVSSELISLQTLYTNKFDQIENYLRHYENLESITKHLSRSGSHLLNQRRDFFKNEILQQLEESILFIHDHKDFKDVELYESRFRQCLTRGLTLVKNYEIGELRSISDGLLRKLHDQVSNNKANYTIELLLYNEFNNYLKYNGNSFNDLINEIIVRVPGHEEYKGLLNDVLNNYFKIRLNFLNMYISHNTTIQKLFSHNYNSTDLVQTSQDQISFFKKTVEREFSLFRNFFIQEGHSIPSFMSDEFYNFLKNILDPLYDSVRQLILREFNINNLCQLTTLLQKYYEFEDDDEELLTSSIKDYDRRDSINYEILFQPILEDVQTRLIFRIQRYVDDTLMKYKPKPEDLKIGNRKKRSTIADKNSTTDVVEYVHPLDVDYSDNLFKDVYLPLGKALTLLSNIYELINSVVFDDLAHYIVHSSISLLKGEFYKLSLTHLGVIDAKLVYLQNLIILKAQINNFDIQYTRNDYSIDFTSGFNDIWQAIRHGEFTFDNSGLIELAKKTVPKIINNMMDANYEIELELNNAVNEFIQEATNIVCEPILLNPKEADNSGILQHPLEKSTILKDNLIIKIPNYYIQIKLFIDNVSIIEFLMNSLSNLIVATYENFYKFFTENIDKLDATGREQFDDIMEVDTLMGFLNDMISNLYEQDAAQNLTSHIEFNEDILKDLELGDSAQASPAPESRFISPGASPGAPDTPVEVKPEQQSTEHTSVSAPPATETSLAETCGIETLVNSENGLAEVD